MSSLARQSPRRRVPIDGSRRRRRGHNERARRHRKPAAREVRQPYANVEIVYDLPGDVAGEPWGLTEPATRQGGRCVIHLAPLGSILENDGGVETLEPVGLPKLIQHGAL